MIQWHARSAFTSWLWTWHLHGTEWTISARFIVKRGHFMDEWQIFLGMWYASVKYVFIVFRENWEPRRNLSRVSRVSKMRLSDVSCFARCVDLALKTRRSLKNDHSLFASEPRVRSGYFESRFFIYLITLQSVERRKLQFSHESNALARVCCM